MSRPRRYLAGTAAVLSLATLATITVPPAPASALSSSTLCGTVGVISGLAGKACTLASHTGRVLKTGGDLLKGHVGSAVSDVLGSSSGAAAAGALSLAAVAVWTTHGASSALHETSTMLSATTNPRVAAPWFSGVYWRVAGIGMLLTLPFLFAAAIQALLRSDLALLLRSAFGYLPLATLGVAVAAQLTGLLLTATDAMCSVVAGASGDTATAFLAKAAHNVATLSLFGSSPFLACMVAVATVLAAIVLWTEMLIREAAVYVILAMLPLAFAALVWPARRVWAVRTVELLVALILSKLAIITVLTLGGAALLSLTATGFLSGFVLLVLAIFAPWAMIRLVPMAELAASAAGTVRGELRPAQDAVTRSLASGTDAHDWAQRAVAGMPSDDTAGPPAYAQESPLRELSRGSTAGGDVETDEALREPDPPTLAGQGLAVAEGPEQDASTHAAASQPAAEVGDRSASVHQPAGASDLVAADGPRDGPPAVPPAEQFWDEEPHAWGYIQLNPRIGESRRPPVPSGDAEPPPSDAGPTPDDLDAGLPPAPQSEDGPL